MMATQNAESTTNANATGLPPPTKAKKPFPRPRPHFKTKEFPQPQKQSTTSTPLTNDPLWLDSCVREGDHGLTATEAIKEAPADAVGYVELVEKEFDALASCDKHFAKTVPLSAYAYYHHIIWWYKIALLAAKHGNGITIDDLDQLSPDRIKEMCPHLGNRLKLTKKINEYLESKAATLSVKTFDSDSIASVGTLVAEENGHLSIAISDLFPSASLNQSFPDFNLKTLLETSPAGKSVLNFYANNNKLDSKRKNRLTDIIIRHLFTFIINKRLTYDDYNVLTGKIITLFPKECPGTYFTRPVRKSLSNSGKSIAARGQLVDKVRNFLFQSNETKRGAELENNPAKKQKTNEISLRMY